MMARMSEHETGSRIPSDDQVAVELLSTMQENVISWLRELGARTASTD
jgi:hypothetical protein